MEIELDVGLNPGSAQNSKEMDWKFHKEVKKKKEKMLEPRPKISFKLKSQT
jgi:hypothetical protein